LLRRNAFSVVSRGKTPVESFQGSCRCIQSRHRRDRTRKEKGISRLRGGGEHLSLVSKNETVPVPSAEPPPWLNFFLFFLTGFQE
ncbi:hypothetical protein, partial [Desulfonatronospira sp.]|uniref:hypothetical protein n=1 Tax=Desulfonatronospira sp. TaxID=1962951 RepID=UPI0025BAAF23